MLSDEELIEVYALNCDCEGTRVMLNGLRAVAEAAVKDAVGGDEPFAYYIHVAAIDNGYYVDDLDDEQAVDDLTNHDCVVMPLYTRPQASAAVPENMAVVPRTMILKPEAMESLQFILGGCELDNDEAPLDERWLSGILFVGEVEDDHGKVVHGIHVYSEDYPEEGSVTLVEFTASQQDVNL